MIDPACWVNASVFMSALSSRLIHALGSTGQQACAYAWHRRGHRRATVRVLWPSLVADWTGPKVNKRSGAHGQVVPPGRPAARTLFTALRPPAPEFIDLVLSLAAHLKRDRKGSGVAPASARIVAAYPIIAAKPRQARMAKGTTSTSTLRTMLSRMVRSIMLASSAKLAKRQIHVQRRRYTSAR
jgi:hypothetical protein